jgi:DNA-binding transcriptional ArsR family regulator
MDESFYCLHSEICKTLANAKRQMILGALRDRELSVSQLVEETDIPQSNLSQHLALLRANGVVRTRREGSHVFYAITNPKIIQAFDLITEVMQEAQDERSRTAQTIPSPTGRKPDES